MPTFVGQPPDPATLPTEPDPGPSGDGSTFLTRTQVAVKSFSGGSSASVSNVSIFDEGGSKYTNIGITISGVVGSVSITDVDLADLAGGIYIVDCSGTLVINNVRGRNIGDGTIGSGHGNFIQFSRCSFDGYVANCQFKGGLTEDMISIYKSGGVGVGQELVIRNNALQGLTADTGGVRKWTSTSGTGIIVGDSPGDSRNHDTIVRNNTLLTPGQVGLQHIDGPRIYTHDNIVYGEKRVSNNNPITTYAGNPSGTIANNTYYWTNNDDSHPTPYNGAGTMTFTGNTQDSGLVAADYVVTL